MIKKINVAKLIISAIIASLFSLVFRPIRPKMTEAIPTGIAMGE